MKLSVFPSSMETARSLVFHLVDIMNAEPDKTFSIAVSSGNAPISTFDLWTGEYAGTTPWKYMKLYWVDERCVPPEDSGNNYGVVRFLLLGIVPIPYENVYHIRGEEKPAKEAARYSELVSRQVPKKGGWSESDIVLLGAEDGGHTSSIFPGQKALLSFDQTCVTSTHPRNGQECTAMTGSPILIARLVIFLITGKVRAGVVEEICHSRDTGPAAHVTHHAENIEFFMDAGAAMYMQDDRKERDNMKTKYIVYKERE